jgi:glutamate-1-semialdehyde 2,1-aminomutase
MAGLLKTSKSKELFEEAKKSILGGVASGLHKSEYESYPIYIERGKGSKLYDVDGNEYIDYMGGFGPMILGYCHPAIGEVVIEQIAKGSQFAAPNPFLNDVSKKLTELIPCADLVSYQGTGTEANMVIFRMVRAYTGKDKIVKFEGHYHGWSDEEIISFTSDSVRMMGPRNRPWKTLGSAGQLAKSGEDVIVLPWNDLELVRKTIRRQRHEIAGIITEPIMLNCEVVHPKSGYLEGLREIATENDVVLIFDEIITGFRLCLGGAQEYFKVTPDISSFGKAVAGGFPLAGVAGKREIMEAGVHPGGTFNANPISIAACKATIRELEKPGIYKQMARLTKKLTTGINRIAKKRKLTLYCDGIESIWHLAFGIRERVGDYRDNFKVNKMDYQVFRKGCLERGVRLHPSRGRFYVSAAHTDEDIDKTLSVVEEVMTEMSKRHR